MEKHGNGVYSAQAGGLTVVEAGAADGWSLEFCREDGAGDVQVRIRGPRGTTKAFAVIAPETAGSLARALIERLAPEADGDAGQQPPGGSSAHAASGHGHLTWAATTPMWHRCHRGSIDAPSASLASRGGQVPDQPPQHQSTPEP